MAAMTNIQIRVYKTSNAAGRGRPAVHRVEADDGVMIRVLDWEEDGNLPFYILHGSQGNASMWEYLADSFPDRRVVASDHRGYGETEGPVGTCTTERHVRDMDAVRRGVGLKMPILIGFSGGAVDSVHYAATHPGVISALILLDPPMFGPPPKEVMDFFAKAPREFSNLDDYIDVQRGGPLARGANVRLLRLYGTYSLRPGADGILRPLVKPHAQSEWNQSMAKLDVWGLAARIKIPTLVVRAGGAPILPQEVAEKLVSTLGDGRLSVVEGASHALPLDDPDALHDAIRDFLKDVDM